MIDIDSEDYKKLEERCKNHVPPYDPERIIQFANAIPLLVVKKRHQKNGSCDKNITCFKSRKYHLRTRRNKLDDF